MKTWAVFDAATGLLEYTTSSGVGFAPVVGEGYGVVELTEPIGLAPQAGFVYRVDTKQWEDPRTLADLKAAKNDAINRARAAANSSYFVFQGKRIAADPLSRSDIDAAHGAILMLQALPPGWPGGWKSMENEIIPITTVAEWAQFYGTMVATGTANFTHAQALKTQLAAATTPEDVEAVPSW